MHTTRGSTVIFPDTIPLAFWVLRRDFEAAWGWGLGAVFTHTNRPASWEEEPALVTYCCLPPLYDVWGLRWRRLKPSLCLTKAGDAASKGAAHLRLFIHEYLHPRTSAPGCAVSVWCWALPRVSELTKTHTDLSPGSWTCWQGRPSNTAFQLPLLCLMFDLLKLDRLCPPVTRSPEKNFSSSDNWLRLLLAKNPKP